jgi:hypothetical protein
MVERLGGLQQLGGQLRFLDERFFQPRIARASRRFGHQQPRHDQGDSRRRQRDQEQLQLK